MANINQGNIKQKISINEWSNLKSDIVNLIVVIAQLTHFIKIYKIQYIIREYIYLQFPTFNALNTI